MTNQRGEKEFSSQIFLAVITFLQSSYDFDMNSFLQKRGLSIVSLSQDGKRIKSKYLYELIDELLIQTNDYTLFYKLAKMATPNSLGVLGYLMIHSKTLYDALNNLCKYYLLIGKSIKPLFSKVDSGYKITLISNSEKGELLDFEKYTAQIHLFALLHLINNTISTSIKPKYITFTQEKPKSKNFNSKIEDIDLFFEQEENAIYYQEDITQIKTIAPNEHLMKIFEKEAEESLQIKLSESGLKEKISSLILISSTELDISLESIASKLEMHPRTLQIKLKEEGTSFSKLLFEVRKKLSIYYLSRGIDISTISISLGYIDLSSFFRAFKKWYGMTPKQWKEKNS